MKVINFWGSPGSGKSTIASGLFYMMKCNGYKVELINEYAKDLVWSNRMTDFENQLYIFAKQYKKQEALSKHNLDYIITDSPLMCNLLYLPKNYFEYMPKLVIEIHKSFDCIDYLIERQHSYESIGRNENEQEAVRMQLLLKKLLEENNINYITKKSSFTLNEEIFKEING